MATLPRNQPLRLRSVADFSAERIKEKSTNGAAPNRCRSVKDYSLKTYTFCLDERIHFTVPAGLIKFVANILGKGDVAQRLCGSLQVDIEKTRRLLGWNPPLTLNEGLKKAADGFKT